LGTKTIFTSNDKGYNDPGSLSYVAAVVPHLLNTLISYWKMDEASGTRADSKGTNNLTDNNVTSAPGIINNGASFIAANSAYLTHLSNTDLQLGGTNLTIALWCNVIFGGAGVGYILLSKDGTIDREYSIEFDGVNSVQFFIFTLGGYANVSVAATISLGALQFVVAQFNNTTGQMLLSINGGTPVSVTTPGLVIVNGASPFFIGGRARLDTFFTGVIDEVGIWKRLLTAGEITTLYNGGIGLPFSSFTP
jgi:hypothetical protein